MLRLVSPKIIRQTYPDSSHRLCYWVLCRIRWVAVICHRFTSDVLNYLSMANVLGMIVLVLIDGRFSSARIASTGVARSWPVMDRPA